MMQRETLTLAPLIVLLAACVTPASDSEIAAATQQSLPELPSAWTVEGAMPGEVRIGWIDALGDPQLTALVYEAQRNNRNIQAAAANVEASRALVRQARSALLPQVNAVASAENTGFPDSPAPDRSSFNLSAQAQWEPDLWGRIRAGRNAAYASAQAVEADFLFAQYSLAQAVASAYFASIEAELQVGVAQRTVDALAEIDRIVRVRYREGFASAQDTATASSDYLSAQDSLLQAQAGLRSTRRALEVLVGRYPSDAITTVDDLPETPPPPPAGLPSELLERRPDIIAAERRVATAFANLDQARAARLPSLSLTAGAGSTSTDLGNLLSGPSLFWTIAGNVLQPIFDGGRRDAAVDEADANRRGAIAAYSGAALAAFQDVENNLDQVQVLAERERILELAAVEASTSYVLAQLQYDEGEIALIDVLNIQQRLFAAERSLVAVRSARINQWVALNLALGGSWE